MKIVPLKEHHFEQWRVLFSHYIDFYEVRLTKKALHNTWKWLMDEHNPLIGLGAEMDGRLVGFVHFNPVPYTLRGEQMGFLNDMYVDKKVRGMNVAFQLLMAIRKHAQKNGWRKFRWITKDDNYRARNFYDKIASKTEWNLYEMRVKK